MDYYWANACVYLLLIYLFKGIILIAPYFGYGPNRDNATNCNNFMKLLFAFFIIDHAKIGYVSSVWMKYS